MENERLEYYVLLLALMAAIIAILAASMLVLAAVVDAHGNAPDNTTNGTDTPSRASECPEDRTPVYSDGEIAYCVIDNIDAGNDTPSGETPTAEAEGIYLTESES